MEREGKYLKTFSKRKGAIHWFLRLPRSCLSGPLFLSALHTLNRCSCGRKKRSYPRVPCSILPSFDSDTTGLRCKSRNSAQDNDPTPATHPLTKSTGLFFLTHRRWALSCDWWFWQIESGWPIYYQSNHKPKGKSGRQSCDTLDLFSSMPLLSFPR